MKPRNFYFQNTVYSKNQKKYHPLPAFKYKTERGEVVSCWRLTFLERIKVLFTGDIWLMAATFNRPLTPFIVSPHRKDVVVFKNENLMLKERIKIWFKGFKK